MTAPRRLVRVAAVAPAAAAVRIYDLRPAEGGLLPPFAAGAHVDLHLANGLVRSYSLLNPGETHRYMIAVQRDPASRGGSSYIHDSLCEGAKLEVGAPRNNFELHETAPHTVLIAGGIGITPLWAMVQRLAQLGASWRLHYCARTPEQAAFKEELSRFAEVAFHFDEGKAFLDVRSVVEAAPAGTHFYCCGPASMLAAFEAATAHLPAEVVHLERFSGAPKHAAAGFTVVLARSGMTVDVPAGRSILEVLLEAGLDIHHSCTEGVCGSCETRVLEGVPEHRDLILSEAERESGSTMMICCSAAKSERLVLDL